MSILLYNCKNYLLCMDTNTFFSKESKSILKYNAEIFKEIIDESILTDVFDYVINDKHFAYYYKSYREDEKIFFSDVNFITKICKMIAMNHYAKSFIYKINGRTNVDKQYKKNLAEEVLKMIPLERLAAFNCSIRSSEIYLPITFYVSVMTNFFGNKFDEFQSRGIKTTSCYNSEFNFEMLYKIILKIKSCIALVEVRTTDELLAAFRTLVETFLIYLSLWNESDDVINLFKKHNSISFDFNYGKPIPEEIKKEAAEFKENQIKYMNYGWMRKLKKFDELKGYKFNLGTLAEYLNKIYGNRYGNIGSCLYKFFKICNPQTHFTLDFMNYFQLELFVFLNVAKMLQMLSHFWCNCLLDFECEYKGINLDDRLSSSHDEAEKIYDFVNSNEECLRQTNEDFLNRFLCSLKIG